MEIELDVFTCVVYVCWRSDDAEGNGSARSEPRFNFRARRLPLASIGTSFIPQPLINYVLNPCVALILVMDLGHNVTVLIDM
jgi:hypothetical protein